MREHIDAAQKMIEKIVGPYNANTRPGIDASVYLIGYKRWKNSEPLLTEAEGV